MPPRLIAPSRQPLQDYTFVADLDDLKIAPQYPLILEQVTTVFSKLVSNGAKICGITKERSELTSYIAALMGITLPVNGTRIQRIYTALPNESFQVALNNVYNTNPANFRAPWIFIGINQRRLIEAQAIGFRVIQLPLVANIDSIIQTLHHRSDNLYVTPGAPAWGSVPPNVQYWQTNVQF